MILFELKIIFTNSGIFWPMRWSANGSGISGSVVSHPPQEQKITGSNATKVLNFEDFA
jgi:hypothetical protein